MGIFHHHKWQLCNKFDANCIFCIILMLCQCSVSITFSKVFLRNLLGFSKVRDWFNEQNMRIFSWNNLLGSPWGYVRVRRFRQCLDKVILGKCVGVRYLTHQLTNING